MISRSVRIVVLACALLGGCGGGAATSTGVVDLAGAPVDPVAPGAPVVVLLFARTDCPISNRYAPEVRRLVGRFADDGVRFWLVYPDPDTTAAEIRTHLEAYDYPCDAARDPRHALVDLVQATVTPEAAVFDTDRRMVYRGRIDDRYVDFGQARPAPTTHDLERAIEAALAGTTVADPRTSAIGCFIVDLPREAP
ncbi:MAG: redoxin domain-containing protein [Planctomycetota bacterium]|jgi:hypothetical protein